VPPLSTFDLYHLTCTPSPSPLEEEGEAVAETARSIAWELILFFGTLSQRGLNPIKLAYSSIKLAGWPALLTASTFHSLGEYASSPGNRVFHYAELAVSFLMVALIIASTHLLYP